MVLRIISKIEFLLDVICVGIRGENPETSTMLGAGGTSRQYVDLKWGLHSGGGAPYPGNTKIC